MNGLNPSPLLVFMPFAPWLSSSSREANLFPYALNLVSDAWLALASRKSWNGLMTDVPVPCLSLSLSAGHFLLLPSPRQAHIWIICGSQEKDEGHVEQSQFTPNKPKLDWPSLRYKREPSQNQVNPPDGGEKVSAVACPKMLCLFVMQQNHGNN